MRSKYQQLALVAFCFMFAFWLSTCQNGSAPMSANNGETSEKKRLSPDRVDIRGSIIRSRYNQGQVMLEVEGTPSQNSRYNRAYVLVLPSTQIVGRDGTSISLSELRQGQDVAILLRSGGKGNLEGIGTARIIWLE
jgi:hypothetical protein